MKIKGRPNLKVFKEMMDADHNGSCDANVDLDGGMAMLMMRPSMMMRWCKRGRQ